MGPFSELFEKVVQGTLCHNEESDIQCDKCPYQDTPFCKAELQGDQRRIMKAIAVLDSMMKGE